MRKIERKQTRFTTEDYYCNHWDTPALQFPKDAFMLIRNYNGELTLHIQERYAIEIITRILSDFDYNAFEVFIDKDASPFNLLPISEGQIYVLPVDRNSVKAHEKEDVATEDETRNF